MQDLGVIDQFTNVFSQYIDTGFGLLRGEVAFLTATLVVIDVTLAGLFWAMGGDDVIAKLIKKTLYVGAFAFIITNFNALSRILFHSFAGLGILATGSNLAEGDLLRPGRLAAVGMTAAQPILDRLGVLTGFPDVFLNLDTIVVLLLAWVIVIIAFFVLAVQLFVTLIEFKLTTLAGFVLVPFALWNKTAFLAERVLGNVVSSGIKVLVLAVIVGIGAGIFGQFTVPPAGGITVNSALALMLASLALFGLGLFGPGIATGLVSGAPQLGAGAVAGTALATAGLAVAGGAVTVSAARAAASLVKREDSTPTPPNAPPSPATSSAKPGSPTTPPTGGTGGASVALAEAAEIEPQWARDLKRRQTVSHGVTTAAHVVRSTDHGGAGVSPDLDAGD
jgi:type IV secretion system protein TrbL